jgi:hypothetical protein
MVFFSGSDAVPGPRGEAYTGQLNYKVTPNVGAAIIRSRDASPHRDAVTAKRLSHESGFAGARQELVSAGADHASFHLTLQVLRHRQIEEVTVR